MISNSGVSPYASIQFGKPAPLKRLATIGFTALTAATVLSGCNNSSSYGGCIKSQAECDAETDAREGKGSQNLPQVQQSPIAANPPAQSFSKGGSKEGVYEPINPPPLNLNPGNPGHSQVQPHNTQVPKSTRPSTFSPQNTEYQKLSNKIPYDKNCIMLEEALDSKGYATAVCRGFASRNSLKDACPPETKPKAINPFKIIYGPEGMPNNPSKLSSFLHKAKVKCEPDSLLPKKGIQLKDFVQPGPYNP